MHTFIFGQCTDWIVNINVHIDSVPVNFHRQTDRNCVPAYTSEICNVHWRPKQKLSLWRPPVTNPWVKLTYSPTEETCYTYSDSWDITSPTTPQRSMTSNSELGKLLRKQLSDSAFSVLITPLWQITKPSQSLKVFVFQPPSVVISFLFLGTSFACRYQMFVRQPRPDSVW